MDISELQYYNEPEVCEGVICTALVRYQGEDGLDRINFPFATKRHGKDRKVVLVEDEVTGTVEYKFKYPDGHLGAIED